MDKTTGPLQPRCRHCGGRQGHHLLTCQDNMAGVVDQLTKNQAAVDSVMAPATLHNHSMQATCTTKCPGHPAWTAVHEVFAKDQWPGKMVSVPDLRDKTSAERKAEPIHSGVLLYFPDALAAVARHSKKANAKHNGPDAPLGWTRGKSNDHEECVIRHSLTLESVDPETGEIEAVHQAWRALAQLQILEEKRLAKLGIRPYSGITP